MHRAVPGIVWLFGVTLISFSAMAVGRKATGSWRQCPLL
jgi:hypothetical protein